jgi:hypothetical protein
MKKIFEISKFRRCKHCNPKNSWSEYRYIGNGIWKLQNIRTLSTLRHTWKSLYMGRNKKFAEENYDPVIQKCICNKCSKIKNYIKKDVVY